MRASKNLKVVLLALTIVTSVSGTPALAFDGPAQQRSQSISILFGQNSSVLSSKAKLQLRSVVDQLKTAKSIKVSIAAVLPTAGGGIDGANLAVARENALAKYLKNAGLKATFNLVPANTTDAANPTAKRVQLSYFWFG